MRYLDVMHPRDQKSLLVSTVFVEPEQAESGKDDLKSHKYDSNDHQDFSDSQMVCE